MQYEGPFAFRGLSMWRSRHHSATFAWLYLALGGRNLCRSTKTICLSMLCRNIWYYARRGGGAVVGGGLFNGWNKWPFYSSTFDLTAYICSTPVSRIVPAQLPFCSCSSVRYHHYIIFLPWHLEHNKWLTIAFVELGWMRMKQTNKQILSTNHQ